jgi:anti-sigma regulatory factor (Ser/Thr protein kinase)
VPRVPVRGALPEQGRGLDFLRTVMDEVDIRSGSDGTLVRFVLRN